MMSRFCLNQPVRRIAIGALRVTLVVALALAVGMNPAEAAKKKKRAAAAPTVNKYAALVIDATSGKVLHQEHADAKRHPASLTKMMTLYMTFAALERGQLTLNQRLFVSPQAAAAPPSKLGLRPGDRLRVEDAILGLVTRSANDASVVLAEAIGGSEPRFAQLMTETAQKLGMNNTVFKNASGLPNNQQITTARDMAKLALGLLRHYPQYYSYFNTASFEYKGETYNNHNRLMARFQGMDGIKTGFINSSGFNLVASAVRDGHRLVGVIFGGRSAASRDTQLEKLMVGSFDRARQMDRVQMASGGAALAPTPASFSPPAPARKPEAVEAAVAQAPATQTVDNSLEGVYGQGDAEPQVQLVAETQAQGQILTQPAVVTREQVAANLAAQPTDSWGIQIGAYADRASAQRALAIVADQYAEMLGKATTRVMPVDAATGTIYRARLVGLDQRSARQACARMQRQGRACLTLPPSSMATSGTPQAVLASAYSE